MEEYEKQHANVESLAMTQRSHKQKDHIWLFAGCVCIVVNDAPQCLPMPSNFYLTLYLLLIQ